MIRVLGFLLLGVTVALLPSCASEQSQDPNHVTTIPWNRPEQWEGQGPMGGMLPGSQ